MVSLQECRKILGPSCALSDIELENLRETLYTIADIAIVSYPKLRTAKTKTSIHQYPTVSFESMLNLLSKTESEDAMERVAIMEFEGNLSRIEAETLTISKFFNSNQRN